MGIPYILFGKREPSSSTSINHLVLHLLSYNQISSARHPEGLIAQKSIDCPQTHSERVSVGYEPERGATEGFLSQMDR